MSTRYSIGEWYGYDFARLSPERWHTFAQTSHKTQRCPFKRGAHNTCSKKGGVCSLRAFRRDDNGVVVPESELVTTCPHRFFEANQVFTWVGEHLLGNPDVKIVSEVPFLVTAEVTENDEKKENPVGKIDHVLVADDGANLAWCALEMQAVYFSGKSMSNDFAVLKTWPGPSLPWPPVQRRPDFRSSGPKRLMPQLQTKVPTISRWGKKTAVVVDKAFWNSLGEIREGRDLSNAEIVWFIVSYEPDASNNFRLRRDTVHYTTLSNAVESLTGGTPMSRERFESELRARLKAS